MMGHKINEGVKGSIFRGTIHIKPSNYIFIRSFLLFPLFLCTVIFSTFTCIKSHLNILFFSYTFPKLNATKYTKIVKAIGIKCEILWYINSSFLQLLPKEVERVFPPAPGAKTANHKLLIPKICWTGTSLSPPPLQDFAFWGSAMKIMPHHTHPPPHPPK